MTQQPAIVAQEVIEGPWKLPDGWEWRMLGGAKGVCEINPRRPKLQRADNDPTSFLPMESVDERLGIITDLQTMPFGTVRKGYTYF